MNTQKNSPQPSSTSNNNGLFERNIYKSGMVICFLLILTAFLLRLTAFFLLQEKAGDATAHATLAYMWAMLPVYRPHTVWLPGYIYLTGAFNMVVNDPLQATRIFNLLLGTLTVPVFYCLIRRFFDHVSALLSAILLTIFPFHIELSVTSLSEVSFVFELIAGTLLVLKASEVLGWRSKVGLLLSIFVFGFASLTRYEAWILLPLFPMYFFLKTGRFYQSTFLAIGLAVFPFAWMAATYMETGSFLPAYGAALIKSGGGTSLPLALTIIASYSVKHIGWLIPLLAVGGFSLLAMDAAKRQLNIELFLYLAIVFVTGSFIVKFSMDRGVNATLADRTLLFILVTSLPLCTIVISRYFRRKPFYIIFVALVVSATLFISQVRNMPNLVYTTTNKSNRTEVFGRWLKDSTFRNSPLILTSFQFTHLPLYRPEISFRYIVVSSWRSDSHLRDFISIFQPQLLITRDNDDTNDKKISRVEKLIGSTIREESIVYDQDNIKAYDLRGEYKTYENVKVPTGNHIIVGPGFLVGDAETALEYCEISDPVINITSR